MDAGFSEGFLQVEERAMRALAHDLNFKGIRRFINCD